MDCDRRRFVLAASAFASIAHGAALAQTRPRLALVTGAAGGAFAEYGPAFATVAATHAAIDCDVEPTGGSNDNLRALARGEADLGLVNMGPAFDARAGRPPFTAGADYASLRALLPMYETPFGLVALKRSRIASLSDLSGRVVGVGPAGGPGEVFFVGLAAALGLKARIATGSPSELARRVIAGEVDAFWYGAGPPVTAFVEVLDRADAVVLGLDAAEIAALRRTFAYFAPAVIAAGTYKGQTGPLTTASVWNFVLSTDRLSDEAAYALTAAALDHAGEIAAVVPAAAGTRAVHVLADTFMPLHPGAARYYRERGVALPAYMVP